MNKKLLTVAVGSALAFAGAMHTVSAQSLQETGDKLLGAMYTVNDDNETYINIVNTTASSKAVKVRLREGRGSEDVLDFHVYLSPFDMWTASLTIGVFDGEEVPVLITADTSCTAPNIGMIADGLRDPNDTGNEPRAADLRTINIPTIYAGGDATAAQQRIREGYIEIIEMADFGLQPAGISQPGGYGDRAGKFFPNDGTSGEFTMGLRDIQWAIKHDTSVGGTGVPRDCNAIRALNSFNLDPADVASYDSWGHWTPFNDNTTNDDDQDGFGFPTGGLFGNVAIINVGRATMIGYEMDAIDSDFDPNNGNIFFSQTGAAAANNRRYTADRSLASVRGGLGLAFNDLPDLSTITSTSGQPFAPMTYVPGLNSLEAGGNQVEDPSSVPDSATQWVMTDIDALLNDISDALAASTVMNEYITDEGLKAATDWVVTFPTKHFYSNYAVNPDGSPVVSAQAFYNSADYDTGPSRQTITNGWLEPFSSGFNTALGRACDPILTEGQRDGSNGYEYLGFYDREERAPSQGIVLSPLPVGADALCYEMNVISFNEDDLSLPSFVTGGITTRFNIDLQTGPGQAGEFQNGWGTLGLGKFEDLPAIGFMAWNIVNEVNGDKQYGHAFRHRFGRNRPM